MLMQLNCIFFLCVILSSLFSCTNSTKKHALNRPENELIAHEITEAATLNPINVADGPSMYVIENIFQTLIAVDPFSLQLTPVLADSLPIHYENAQGEQFYTYKIRSGAKWDNGEPITAKDVEFTLKVIKNPKVDDASSRTNDDIIHDFIFDNNDPKKFTIVLKEKYLKAIITSGDIPVLPRYIYDPKGMMNGFSVKQLSYDGDKLANDTTIIKFAEWFNSEKFQRQKEFIAGSGAYELEEWITGQKIVLKRKEQWWGDILKGTNPLFDAEPKKITYQIINDYAVAVTALLAENIDVIRSIPANKFIELKESEKAKSNYNFYTPDQLAYYGFGINCKLPKFSDKKTRQALAHIVDVNKIIELAAYGMGKPTIGPIYPGNKKFYNNDIVPYDYNLETAKQLLAEAGWKDTDGDGFLDKILNGKKEKFTIKITYNQGNDARKTMATLFQEEARKVGIDVDILGQDMSIFVDTKKKHDFEIYIGGFQLPSVPDDPKQVFYTTSATNGGSNYVSFGTIESDSLIDKIRTELDEDKRAMLYKRLQEIIHDEACTIFVYFPTEKIAIHKRFINAQTTTRRPGYWLAGMKAVEAE